MPLINLNNVIVTFQAEGLDEQGRWASNSILAVGSTVTVEILFSFESEN